jgi:hypothetical protein
MNISCTFGSHKWAGCKCLNCGKTRDEGHDWRKEREILEPDSNGITLLQVLEKCAKCGATQTVVDPKDMEKYQRECFQRRIGRR